MCGGREGTRGCAEAEREKEEKESQAPIEIPHDLLVAIYEKSKEEPIPVTPEEKHQYFVGVVAMAERLVAQGMIYAQNKGLLYDIYGF